MDLSDEFDTEVLNEFKENDEWDACFRVVENWEDQQELIEKSNAVDDEEQPRLEHMQVLKRCFGHKSFRPMQWKIISSIINDRRDNCAIMATGYGKSLCFQYPSVYIGGITIVVSPLISLMEDQVLSLEMSNISACLLGTAQTKKRQVMDEIFENKYSLVYLTPEFCCGDYGQDMLKRMNDNLTIILLAIDEAHCVSSWGHDFRFQYRELGKLRELLPQVPILAVTATATPKVRNDIVNCLKLRNPQVLCSGFDRPNLQFSVYLKGPSTIRHMKKILTDSTGSTIVYCITRKQTVETAEMLRLNGFKCLAYHAGMSVTDRKAAHEKFAKDKVKMIVATIAFGMGIDKPDVRTIIHFGASKDIESYYQEVGRAGRDGQSSLCITFYSSADFDLHRTIQELSGTNNINRARRADMEKIMIQYLESRDCRRRFLLNHFEGSVISKDPKQQCCDNCTRQLTQVSDSNKYEGLDENGLYDFAKDAKLFLSAVDAMNGKFGIVMYIQFLRGSKTSKLYDRLLKHPLYGAGKHTPYKLWKVVGKILDREGYLQKSTHSRGAHAVYSTYSVSAKGSKFLAQVVQNPSMKLLFTPPPELFEFLKVKKPADPPEEKLFKPSQRSSTSTIQSNKQKLLPIIKKSVCDSTNKVGNKDEITGVNEVTSNTETELEKQERMMIYRTLMNKRTDIASRADCMPYMVASNEALMKLAQMKPISIKALRECQLDGFTEAKISRFGEEFIKTIRVLCHLDANTKPEDDNNKKSIEDILAEYALPGAKMAASAEASYSMFKSGLTVLEIATKRGVVVGTVISHLVDALKMGYPIQMIELNITDEIRDTIRSAIDKIGITSDLTLMKIKNECPPEITYDAIRVVFAYVQVRTHLKVLGVPYEEFEEFPFNNSVENSNKRKESEIPDEGQHKKLKFSSLSIKKFGSNVSSGSNDSLVLSYGPNKTNLDTNDKNETKVDEVDNLSFLDSPPRASTSSVRIDTDLDQTLLDDDFFDESAFDNVEQAINKSISQEEYNQESVGQNTSYNKFNTKKTTTAQENWTKESLVQNTSPNISLGSECSVDCSPTEKKLKKFQFKSRVPSSVKEKSLTLLNSK